ncbi:hypothetical protein NFI96_014057 [Prochilodus magdalenae]|nr:hypothetical protein NFI96_014057 [Prochilodus magdalenae]
MFLYDSPPLNVAVTCHNFKNVVHWNYSDPNQDSEFKVTVRPYRGGQSSIVTTVQKYLDITSYTADPTEVYFVTVDARPKGSESASSSTTVQFAYDQEFPSTARCVVDFPAVNISDLHHAFEVSFYHPYEVYEHLNDTFEYKVICNETECGSFECDWDELCKEIIHLPESLYGRCFSMHLEGVVNNFFYLETSKEVCNRVRATSKLAKRGLNQAPYPLRECPDPALVTSLVCAGVGVLLLLILAGAMMYKRMTRSDSQSTIVSKLLNMVTSSSIPSVVVPEQPHVSKVQSVSHTPLLLTPDEVVSTSTSPSTTEITHFPIQSTTVESWEEQDGNEEDGNFDDSSGFTCDFSGYDSKKFLTELSPGDAVEAYRP